MTLDPARVAAVNAALPLVPEQVVIGLGSGRAVFLLTEQIGQKYDGRPPVKAVVASSKTAAVAEKAGIEIVDLDANTSVHIAFDGADEIDNELALIKGGGAALLREKLIIAAAKKVVIFAEEKKKVDRLGQTRLLPVEIVRYGWQTTRSRVLDFVESATLRQDENGQPVVTDENHLLLDVPVPAGDIRRFAAALKSTLGVVDHGLFIDLATDVLLGHEDGSVTSLQKWS